MGTNSQDSHIVFLENQIGVSTEKITKRKKQEIRGEGQEKTDTKAK